MMHRVSTEVAFVALREVGPMAQFNNYKYCLRGWIWEAYDHQGKPIERSTSTFITRYRAAKSAQRTYPYIPVRVSHEDR